MRPESRISVKCIKQGPQNVEPEVSNKVVIACAVRVVSETCTAINGSIKPLEEVFKKFAGYRDLASRHKLSLYQYHTMLKTFNIAKTPEESLTFELEFIKTFMKKAQSKSTQS